MNDSARSNLKAIYDRRFAALSDYRRGVWAILARKFFQPLVPEHGAVLDLGCGWGEFINQIRARHRFGMDMNRSSLDHLDDGVVFLNQDCSEPWALEDNSLDAIFTSNHLEHLSDKDRLRTTLIEGFRCLKSGGRMICIGPNIKHLTGAYWDFWDHFVPLTELSLKEGLELVGFRVERCVGRFLPYTMTTGFRWPLWTVSLYLKVPLLWWWRGKQFLLIAVKP
jgi:ubiquinone/menaquinone biosynthesis C-methylase UbiE